MTVTCNDCDIVYGSDKWIEAVVPDTVWEMIKPDGCGKGAGILCISCMAGRIKALGINDVPVIFSGTEPFAPLPRDMSYDTRLAIVRHYTPGEWAI